MIDIICFSENEGEQSDASASSSVPRSVTPGGTTPTQAGMSMMPPSPVSREQLQKRIESLQQQNKVLKCELDTYKLRVKSLQEENRAIRQASVHIQVRDLKIDTF